jgi:type VI secretion system secreted protein VgrG
VWRSQTHQGAGFNELSFEDQAGQEQVYLHAQKDLKQQVLNDVQTDIGNDSHLTVANDSFMEVKNNQHIRINGECQLTVLKDDVDVAEANFYRKVTGEHQLTAKQEIHLRSGAKAILEAKQAITLKAGGNFITIDANGIQLMSQNVTFNEGGEAAIGTGITIEKSDG